MKVSGNDLFVTAMKKEGVDTIFAYPGGMVVNLLDALHDCHGIDLVLPRHEQGLIHAADGYARATGKVGVCLVTSGPGATNLVTGIATANYDSIPLVCFTGQVPEHLIGNDAFQEVDIIGVTRNIAKFVIMVRDREMLAQRIKEAFYIARSGKPGPVLVDLPTDVMAELGSTSYPTEVNIRGYKPNKGVHVGQLKKAINLLEEAKKPKVPSRPTSREEYDILKKHLSSFFNTKVQFTCNDEGKGRISIPFKNEEELERLMAIFDQLK